MHVLLAAKHSVEAQLAGGGQLRLCPNYTCSACSLVLSSSWVLLAVSTESFTRAGKNVPTQEAGTSSRSSQVSKASTAVISSPDCKACWVTYIEDRCNWDAGDGIKASKLMTELVRLLEA